MDPKKSNHSDVAEAVMTRLHHLSREQQKEVLDFVEFLDQKRPSQPSIGEKMEARRAQIRREILDELPADASKNLDHYLYGAPKK